MTDNVLPMASNALYARCQPIVKRVLKDNGWELVSADDKSFVEMILDRIVERLPAGSEPTAEITDDMLIRATKNAYCAVLYQVYKDDGSEEQIQAMIEVKNYVYRRLFALTQGDRAMSDECAQDAITQAWLHWHEVRDPGSFLGYVQRIGVRRVLDLQRRDERLDPLPNGNGEQRNAPDFSISGRELEQAMETSDLFKRTFAALQHCLSRLEEVRIIEEHLLLGMPYKEMVKTWNRKASYLHLLKFRALKKLAECKEFMDLRREWLDGRQSESSSWMNNSPRNLIRLFTAVSAGHDSGSCEECRARLPALVEAEMADEDIAGEFPTILTHLDTCEDCDAEQAALLDIALIDARGQLPEPIACQ